MGKNANIILFCNTLKDLEGCNQWRKTNLCDDGKSEGKAVHIYSEKYLFHEYNLSAGYRDLCPTYCLVMEQGLSGCAVSLMLSTIQLGEQS